MPFLTELTFWHWLILGVALIILEALLPGVVFLWMGLAALVTGVVVLVVTGLAWQAQTLIFAALSVVSVIAGRMWWRSRPTVTDHPTLNRRGEQHVGRVFTLEAPIVDGVGKIRVDDSTWKIIGADLPAGTQVKVVGADGTILRVEKNG